MSGRVDALSGLLDSVAAGRPHDEAVTDGRVRLDWVGYRDRAASLGGSLLAQGVVPGDRVAVHLPKSSDSFVAAHAIVRIGAVVVPVDWFAPTDYAAEVLRDADVAAIVTAADSDRLGALGTAVDGRIVVAPDATGVPAAVAHVAPASAAYIVYTSGSTGRPKGIVHSHASALAYARKAIATYALTPADRLANIAPLHFDQSTFELWAAPLAGASVVVVPDGVLRFPASVSDLVARERVTVWYSVPYAISQLVSRGAVADRDLSSLRWVLFGGESFSAASLAQARLALPHAWFSNVYGPAEVNQCTFHHLEPHRLEPDRLEPHRLEPSGEATDALEGVVPIGRPWADTEVMLVDADDREVVGPGDGELLVSTDTMMVGYWNRPDLTAAAVCLRPGSPPDRRWYRTGDRVRRRGDGLLVFLGRTDHQVKIRGHRIELEAIESTLSEAPAVVACAVVVERASPDRAGQDRLVALVAPAPDRRAIAMMIDLLRRRLPRYAVPQEIVGVAAIPRSGTGKIDRSAAVELLSECRQKSAHAEAAGRSSG